jgi:hypothetical protein
MEANATKPHKTRAGVFPIETGVFEGTRYFFALSFQTAYFARK